MSSPYLFAMQLTDERALTNWHQLYDALQLRNAPLELLECVDEVIANLDDIYNQADGLYYSEQQQQVSHDTVPISKSRMKL